MSTGIQTYFGALAHRVTATDYAVTSFQLGVNKVSWLLIRFMLVMAPIVLFINGFTKGIGVRLCCLLYLLRWV